MEQPRRRKRETTNKRNDEVVSGNWVANEGRGNGGRSVADGGEPGSGWMDGRVLDVIMYLGIAYQSNTSYKPVSVCPFVVQGKMRG